MKILNLIQVGLCLFATVWLTTAAYSGWKAGPPPSKNPSSSGRPYYGVAPYYGGSNYGGSSRSSGGSWGGGK